MTNSMGTGLGTVESGRVTSVFTAFADAAYLADDFTSMALNDAKCGMICCPYSCAILSILTLNGTFVSVFTISGNETNL